MAIAKVILNGETLMDVTSDTAAAGSMLSGITATKNDGTKATGTITTKTSSDLTVSEATVTVPAGYYASSLSKSVASGTAGTPTATKGAVSNHSVSVTPSVTNTTGYITGSTKTGTAVTVSASELVSGTKSISANGTNIDVTDYASVDVSVSGGGSTLITKNITANGTYNASSDNADGYSQVTVNVSGGGGASKKQINFIDYDGTVLHSYTKSEWQSVSALPSNPSHTGLTAQGWNWTKAQIDAQLTAMPDDDVNVGQMYITDDGKTRIYIHLEEGRLHPYLGIGVNGTVVVDWGDNSATSTITGISATTAKYADHIYASEGDYIITLTVSNGLFAFFGVSNTSHILKKNTTTTSNIHIVYTNAIQKIQIGLNASIGNYAFNYCYSLTSITIPSSVTSIGTYAFRYCYSLTSITIPNTVTSIGNYALSYCYSLTSIAIPNTVTSIGNYALGYCYSLTSITIPSSVTSVGDAAFSTCFSLANITIPSGVTSIGGNAFNGCYGIAEYHILPTTVPTVGTFVFNSIQSDCVIYVPSASLTNYQTADNWSSYASYMQGE